MLAVWITFVLFSWNVFTSVGSVARNPSTVILFAVNGFRWNYMSKDDTPNMDLIAKKGVKAPYVENVFPTVSMSNLYTIVTGLYPESHGIIADEMFDPDFNAVFHNSNNESRWWAGGEPIWVTNQKKGYKSGVSFWPGYDVEIRGYLPTFSTSETKYSKPFVYPYANRMPAKEQIEMAIKWLTADDPPTFIALYFMEPYLTGQRFGPGAPEVKEAIRNFDKNVTGYLLERLRQVGRLDDVNLILSSDHGMMAYNTSNFVDFDDIVNASTYKVWSGNAAFLTIEPQPGNDWYVYKNLKAAQNKTLLFEVYKKEDVPDSLHFKDNRRIGSIIVIMKEGWFIRSTNLPSGPQPEGVIKGGHGYRNSIKDMFPFFIARGPAFNEDMLSPPFELTDIYPLVCEILGIEASSHNGSLSRVKKLLREQPLQVPTTDSSPKGEKKPFPKNKNKNQRRGNDMVKIAGLTILGFSASVSLVASLLLSIRWCNRRKRPQKSLVKNEERQELHLTEEAS
ncbi:PREDICTED: bis(5'-adenosyl)-triphosphatase enpp4-like [Acropora digitifera]|uniref:bis(5'-adenosyl)-triphosphatase enpp4-like n=1 Tax=Acropora digitifera TaxID=70779 RepID=UPI00077AE2AF|nr:PREDICTED: bis(5'-adenosyl)-triphosphatase enpp4-like [Acropora digitifera]